MEWIQLKARLLEAGSARLSGEPAGQYISRSAAGPSAGTSGSLFFAMGARRVRLGLDEASPIEIVHQGGGEADLFIDGEQFCGRLEPAALHCPRQAYITVSGTCIFHCRYCSVPDLPGRRKGVAEIVDLVESVVDRVDAIAITSGVATSIEEEEAYVLDVVTALLPFSIPIGVSIYPGPETPARLHALGVVEVKFNLEAATQALFRKMCPGLSREAIWEALHQSVLLFGRGRVYSNVLVGLGETDEDLEQVMQDLAGIGVIPLLRPLTPAGSLADRPRPSADRLLRLCGIHERILRQAGLDPGRALTMCAACTGCDLVPGRDT
ncbi:MAG TPA: radical SAM protein [Candidatus Methanoculleus thermohydrogenotrophicum]|jgi:biotin synthase-related radical SAM superfamily protein|nr:radical SAM protein [Candidatus Methanoculleus thermohydrogenotrophicum]NLM82944.1 radical SAM protein [Candidatus Methanoculleus thermohydrogenotrophicum]HOB18133.1 radical SAM protein [Candidatus Methanoculleus thermohydrogenotrophicum]HPZ38254.1 radical SAM protein [Candidatus Methanoculleus thermohydrogenotrophicum]HQC91467.1 radical SAM protein [Candidatus Methanoculleus thermohydrogenotrophicum]